MGASVYVGTAVLGAATGVSQAAAFTVVAAMRVASLRWGLQTPLPVHLGEKLTPRRQQASEAPPKDTTYDKPQ